jgi:hypothetical protein
MLGIWLSEHPYTHAAPKLAPYVNVLCNEITPELLGEGAPAQGRDFVMAGIVGSTRRLATRDGRSFIAAEVQDLSGVFEVTVWPDVYERTQDYWLPGTVLLLQVRIRERGDRLTAGVQEVVRFEEDFLPPVWATEVAPLTPRTNGGNGNGHAYAGPASLPASDSATPMGEDFDASEPLPPGEPAVPDMEPAVPYSPIAPQPVARESLRLALREGADEAEDQRRLATIFRLLQEHPGRDDVFLTIKTREGETIELRLPTAHLDEALTAALKAAVGLDADAASGVLGSPDQQAYVESHA